MISDRVTVDGGGITVTLQGLKFSTDLYLSRAAAVRVLENEWTSGGINTVNYATSHGDGSLVIVGNQINSGNIGTVYTDGAYIAGNTLFDGRIITNSYAWIVGNQVVFNSTTGAINTGGTSGKVNIIGNRIRCNYSSLSNNCLILSSPSTLLAANVIEVNDPSTSTTQQRAIYATNGQVTIVNNVIRGLPSNATRTGEAIYVTAPSTRISGNIITDYQSATATPIYTDSTTTEITHNLCFNNSGECPPGNGNLNTNPMFVDLVNYQLPAASPAIDAGPPDPGMADLDRTRNDIGAHGGPWSFGQYDRQRSVDYYAPYVYPLFKSDSILSGGILEIQALGVARLR
jgi:hypothetical protein